MILILNKDCTSWRRVKVLDLKFISLNKDFVKNKLENRGEDFSLSMIDDVVSLYFEKKSLILEVEELKSKRNNTSSSIPRLKKEGKDVQSLFNEMRELGEKIKILDSKISCINEKINYIMLRIPNIPNDEVPNGDNDSCNVLVRSWGEPRKFDFEIKPHWDIARDLDILDFERSSKVTGSRFVFYKGIGAKLERSLINYFLDKHTLENGYTEIFPPFLANRNSFTGTGQLPKFKNDAFSISGSDYFLIPTAEIPITNYYRDEIINLDDENSIIKFVAYSACFRSEAGSAGRDTRGLIRQHQFNKVELVKFCREEDSYSELEKLVLDAESILKELNLPYRVVKVCKGDLGFSQAFKYDIEVWMPSYGRYVEISSCSNFESFQSRRSNIRYRENLGDKPKFVHTLNGSGLAVGRTFAAILENYQKKDGSIELPGVLQKYFGNLTNISPNK